MRYIIPADINDVTLLSSNVPENDYLAYDPSATYGIGNAAGDDGNTVIYIDDNIHWIVRSLTASNTGNTPTGLSTNTNWVKVSETNRWKMFDDKPTSVTTNPNTIVVSVTSVNIVDSIALLGISGAEVSIVGVDQNGAEFLNQTINLVSTAGIYDAYTYFFEPIVRDEDALVLNLIPYALATYTITISDMGNDVSCGTCIIGKQKDLGLSIYGLEYGIDDYSIKDTNDFGDTIITERTFRKIMDVQSRVTKGQVTTIGNSLNKLRATPLVYVGADDYAGTYIYGFYEKYKVLIDYDTYQLVTYRINGLS